MFVTYRAYRNRSKMAAHEVLGVEVWGVSPSRLFSRALRVVTFWMAKLHKLCGVPYYTYEP